MNPFNPGLDNLDGQMSLPDLGDLSVEFANYEDYQGLEDV